MAQTKIFQDLFRTAQKHGLAGNKTQQARQWFRKAASDISLGKPASFIKSERDMKHFRRNEIMPGHLYMFIYDAKHKATLPYWDAFPIVFPWRKLPDGFIGINLHYVPPSVRAEIMDKLYDTVSNQKMNDNTKLKITYKTLCDICGADAIQPMIHRYLSGHVRSKLYKIPAEHWETAIHLPAEDFRKASKAKVWKLR